MDVRISSDPATDAARSVTDRLRQSEGDTGTAAIAVSGGSTAPGLFRAMSANDLNWDAIEVWQVDERIAPDGDADRNAGQLAILPATAHVMPVTAADVDVAAADYAARLPPRFDVVHLGLGDDGHTASWAPEPHPDAQRAITSTEAVFTIGPFNGRRRMTLGVGVVNAARLRVVLVTGEEKAEAVARWVVGADRHGGAWVDPTLPIAAVRSEDTVVYLDAAAAGELTPDMIDAIDVAPDDGYGRT
ncbi:6-phosphogluconolactonase [Ilumatobacter nonamiensis]|uniref:6-phosphogluconolactonase n=1 Tax=Ilumatobacter nonamiensis TaxID=467093 RepID=UPI000345EB52|nr:6-phosphogluconolactonase [Ilumatobacter nonamiensis]